MQGWTVAKHEGDEALLRWSHLHALLAFWLRTSALARQLSTIRKPRSTSVKTNRGKHHLGPLAAGPEYRGAILSLLFHCEVRYTTVRPSTGEVSVSWGEAMLRGAAIAWNLRASRTKVAVPVQSAADKPLALHN